MKDIVEILKSQGIEVSEDQAKAITKDVAANYKTISEYEKKVSKTEAERDSYKEQLDAANDTLQAFDGVDVKGMEQKIADYEKQVKDQKEDFEKKLYDRDFSDALNSAMGDYKFSSEYAKKSVMEEIKAAGLKLIDGKIIGLNDMVDSIKEKDASAFVDEKQQELEDKKAKFTTGLKDKQGDQKITPAELMKLKNENPDLDISQYM